MKVTDMNMRLIFIYFKINWIDKKIDLYQVVLMQLLLLALMYVCYCVQRKTG